MVAVGFTQTRFTESGVVAEMSVIPWTNVKSWEWKNDRTVLLTVWRGWRFANARKIHVPADKRAAVENMLRAQVAASS